MSRELPDDAGSEEREQSPTDEQGRSAQPGSEDLAQEPEDDGSVPDKQIHRWKGEGGSLHPAD